MKIIKHALTAVGACFFILSTAALAQPYDLPVRLIARADIHQLRYNEYSVRECLDIYNDDNAMPLIITDVHADTWRGHQRHVMGESWFNKRPPLTIQPGKNARVVERKRLVTGQYRRNWWVRWLKFTVTTNRGQFVSNFVASPFKRPGALQSELLQPQIDTLSEPQGLTPGQKDYLQKK